MPERAPARRRGPAPRPRPTAVRTLRRPARAPILRPRKAAPSPPPTPAPAPKPPAALPLVAWTFLLGGFAGLAVGAGAIAVIAASPDAFIPDPELRQGVAAGAAIALGLNVLAAWAGWGLLHHHEDGRRIALVLALAGIFGTLLSASVAVFGGLLAGEGPSPGGATALALVGAVTAAVFFAWSLPVLADPATVAACRRPAAVT